MFDQLEYNRKLIEEFRDTRDQPDGPYAKRAILLLTSIGAKSGRPRTAPMMYMREDGRLLVIASNAGAEKHPSWFVNLSANPNVRVEIGTRTFSATAKVLTGADRQMMWDRLVQGFPFFSEHQAKTERQIPLVELIEVAG